MEKPYISLTFDSIMLNTPRAPKAPKPNAGMLTGVANSPLKRFVYYLFISGFITSLLGLRFFAEYSDAQLNLIVFQVTLAGLGMVHAWYIRYRLGWNEKMILFRQIGFTILTALTGAILFLLIGKLLVNIGRERITLDELLVFIPAWLIFTAPFMLAMTFEMAIHIPKRKYKLWFYSEDQKLPDFDLIDFSNSIILSFELPKRFNDSNLSNFKFKAPVNMTFSDLFYGYLNEYNDAHRENPIEYQDADGKSYGWLFYLKTGSRWRTVILDPHLTVNQNGIKENFIIAPKRFIME